MKLLPRRQLAAELARLFVFGCALPTGLLLGLLVLALFGMMQHAREGEYVELIPPMLGLVNERPQEWAAKIPYIDRDLERSAQGPGSAQGLLATHRASRPVWKITPMSSKDFRIEVSFRWFLGGRWQREVVGGNSTRWKYLFW